MTLNEAIDHCLERANQDCSACAEEHQQLAEWLIELKDRRLENEIQETKQTIVGMDKTNGME